jgi:thiamine-monophosphate kinase
MRGGKTDGARAGKRKSGGAGELELLSRIRARAAGAAASGVRLGIGDDCALLRVRPGEELAVTTDLSIAGQHFRLDWHPAEAVGHRTLARGLSDLAAMGARPVAAFLSLGLPGELTRGRGRSWLNRFLDGILALAAQHGTPLAGGDLAESPVAAADIVLVGAVRSGKALLRSQARVGDSIYVTGRLGGAAAGLELLNGLAGRAGGAGPLKIPARLGPALEPHLYPVPRVAQGLALVRRGLARSGMDLSDGLSTDLARLCRESGVAAEVEAGLLPVFPGATLRQALDGGEDYELLFTAPAGRKMPAALAGVAVTRIGHVVRRRAGRPLVTLMTDGRRQPLEARGWEHFS